MRRLFTDSATLHAAVTLLLVAPFFVLRDIPLYDLPDHIARQHILFGDSAPGAQISSHYAAQPHLFACAIYAVIVVAYEFGQLPHGWRAVRHEFIALLHLAAPAVLYLGFMSRDSFVATNLSG